MVEQVTRIKNEITISMGVTETILKNKIRAEKVLFGIFLYVVAKVVII